MRLANKFNGLGQSKLVVSTPKIYIGDTMEYGGGGNSVTFYNIDIGTPASNRVLVLSSTVSHYPLTGAFTSQIDSNSMTSALVQNGGFLSGIWSGINYISWPNNATANVTIKAGNPYILNLYTGQIFSTYTSTATPYSTYGNGSFTGVYSANLNTTATSIVISNACWDLSGGPSTTRTWTAGVNETFFAGPFTGYNGIYPIYGSHAYNGNPGASTPHEVTLSLGGSGVDRMSIVSACWQIT